MASLKHRTGRWRWLLPVCLGLLFTGAVQAEAPRGTVARALFTTAVTEREPVDRILVAGPGVETVYFFTELRGMEGQTVTHRWEYNGEVVSSVEFEVGGPRWRVYSSRRMVPGQTGRWTAMVVDADGWPLRAVVFDYVADTTQQPQVILPLR